MKTGIFTLIVLFLIFGPLFLVNAVAVPFSESFESYDLGPLDFQGDWHTPDYNSGPYPCVISVVNDRSTEGVQSIRYAGGSTHNSCYTSRYGEVMTNGIWCWDYYITEHTGAWFRIFGDGNGFSITDGTFYNHGTPENATQSIIFSQFPLNRWNEMCIDFNGYEHKARLSINGVFTDWIFNSMTFINRFYWTSQFRHSGVEWIDNFTYPLTPPAVYLGFPPEGTTTIQQTGHFTASGSYFYDDRTLNTWSAVDWSTLTAIFSQSTTTTIKSFSIDISATSTDNFDIPVIIDKPGTYNLNFMFEGRRIIDNVLMMSIPHIATTTIQIGEAGTPIWIETAEPELFEEPEPTGILEHIAWSIKKFFRGLIVPSNNAKQNFLNKISTIKERFPYNYISEFKNFINDVKTGTIQDKPFNFSFFGATGTATFLMTDENISSGGITKKFSDWFRLLFSGFLIIGFVLYLVGFIKRIL